MEDKDRSDQPLPGSVSNQNAEEQPGQGGGDETRREGAPDEKAPSGGGASEGSQSTGHPENAG